MRLDGWLLPDEHGEPAMKVDDLLTDRASDFLGHVSALLKLAGLGVVFAALVRHFGELDGVALGFAFWAILRAVGGRR